MPHQERFGEESLLLSVLLVLAAEKGRMSRDGTGDMIHSCADCRSCPGRAGTAGPSPPPDPSTCLRLIPEGIESEWGPRMRILHKKLLPVLLSAVFRRCNEATSVVFTWSKKPRA